MRPATHRCERALILQKDRSHLSGARGMAPTVRARGRGQGPANISSLALPTEARSFNHSNRLASSLGNIDPIEPKRLFDALPKPDVPSQRETAAPTGIGSGGRDDEIGGNQLHEETYSRWPILATHYGLDAGEVRHG